MISTLVVLARAPHPGEGKSRLRRALPGPAVDALAEAMVADTLAWAVRAGFDHVVVAHRGPADEPLRRWAPDAVWIEQADGDLGARITAALDRALAGSNRAAVQIGTDSPTLPEGLLRAALLALDTAPATLIPADDGGWIALGSTRPLGSALSGVPWSSPHTRVRTIEALTAVGLPPTLLRAHYDVDEPADLLRLAADPTTSNRAPRTLSVLGPLLAALRQEGGVQDVGGLGAAARALGNVDPSDAG